MIDCCNALNFRDESTICTRDIPLSRPDTCVSSGWWINNIVLKISSYLTQCDSPYEHIRRRSEAIIEQEINLGMHLAVGYILLDMPRSEKIDNFAAVLNRYLSNPTLQQKFVIRLTVPEDEKDAEKLFQKYLELKQLCEYPIMLSVCLSFSGELQAPDEFLMRFFSEKMFGLQFHMSCFQSNSKGFPVMHKHAKICKEFMKIQTRMILVPNLPNENLERHYNYMTYLFANHDKLDEENRYEVTYRNYLQSPL
jgi:protein arginine N-methyltransferase 5